MQKLFIYIHTVVKYKFDHVLSFSALQADLIQSRRWPVLQIVYKCYLHRSLYQIQGKCTHYPHMSSHRSCDGKHLIIRASIHTSSFSYITVYNICVYIDTYSVHFTLYVNWTRIGVCWHCQPCDLTLEISNGDYTLTEIIVNIRWLDTYRKDSCKKRQF